MAADKASRMNKKASRMTTDDDESITEDDESKILKPDFKRKRSAISQAHIDAFVRAAQLGTLLREGLTASVAKGIPVNGQHSDNGCTALHFAVFNKRREMVVALLAAGADANVKNLFDQTSMWRGAVYSTADILQLLIDSGGSVNEPDICQTPLIAVVLSNKGDAAVRLKMLLACPELDLDAKYEGKTAEEWAVSNGHPELAAAIAEERVRRVRWSAARCAWVSATARA
jgi:hypothetical protein